MDQALQTNIDHRIPEALGVSLLRTGERTCETLLSMDTGYSFLARVGLEMGTKISKPGPV